MLMSNEFQAYSQSYPSTEVKNKVLRNTYTLLAMTLAFSAITAFASMQLALPRVPFLLHIVVFFALLFGIEKTKNSSAGLALTFVFTGYMGYMLGPILNYYLSIPNGSQIVSSAFMMTAVAFLGLSAYAVTTKKVFSFLSNFIVAGVVVLMVGVLAAWLFELPTLQLALSVGFVLISCAIILWQTGEIVNGGETNYISATVTLYVSIYNLFISLLQLLGFASDD
jgi:modulator of FtsH protease